MKPTKNTKLNQWLEGLIQAIVIVSILFVLFWPTKITGQSMTPTLMAGDWIFCSRLYAWVVEPKHGDIVLFNGDDGNVPMVKRIIAIPGDHVQIAEGKLYLNGSLQQEKYVLGETSGDCDLFVPEGHFFAMGDNRRTSTDSRHYGTIPLDSIKSTVLLRFHP